MLFAGSGAHSQSLHGPEVNEEGGECCRLIILMIAGAVKWFFHHGGRGTRENVAVGSSDFTDSEDSKGSPGIPARTPAHSVQRR